SVDRLEALRLARRCRARDASVRAAVDQRVATDPGCRAGDGRGEVWRRAERLLEGLAVLHGERLQRGVRVGVRLLLGRDRTGHDHLEIVVANDRRAVDRWARGVLAGSGE